MVLCFMKSKISPAMMSALDFIERLDAEQMAKVNALIEPKEIATHLEAKHTEKIELLTATDSF